LNPEVDIFSRYFTSNRTVKIYVGPERKLWFLNEDLLCDRIPFFKGVFKSEFKEGDSKVMELLEDDPEAFGRLVEWVYTSSRFSCDLCQKITLVPRSSTHPYDPAHELQWLRLWVLADKLNVSTVTDGALLTHTSCLEDGALVISPEAVDFVCKHTLEDSALRKHLVREASKIVFGADNRYLMASVNQLHKTHLSTKKSC